MLQTKYKGSALYIHIPFCQAKCHYCGFYSEPIEQHDAKTLVAALLCELDRYDSVENVRTVYIGGGSPGCLDEELLLQLVERITMCWSAISEFTIEFNPEHTGEKILSRLHTAGVNRLSIGTQSFNQSELDFLGRRHSVECVKNAVRTARQVGFDNINLDLIFAIPDSTLESWQHSLQSAIDLEVEHIAAYALTYENDTPLKKALAAGKVIAADEEADRAMYYTAIETLAEAGLEQYEISNFARPGRECRHNLTYWANHPYIGIGPAAGSYWQNKCTINIADIKKYIEAVRQGRSPVAETEVLTAVEVACQTAVLTLRRRRGIDLPQFRRQTGFDAAELFAEPITRYRRLGLIEKTDNRVFLTQRALAIADSILCDFSSL